jgi:hypothetical protein
MSDWEDLYSEVRKRKLKAPEKKKVVQAVEKYGGLLVLDGKYEKAEQIFNFIYAKQKKLLHENEFDQILDIDLNQYDLIVIGCPGLELPRQAHAQIKDFVLNGGHLLTTDWCIQSIIEPIFPGFIAPSKNRTEDDVVSCMVLKPNHPYLEGVEEEMRRLSNQSSDEDVEFKWWLEYRSFPIRVLQQKAVQILIVSWDIKELWGEAPVLVYFDYGNNGGRVIHSISHLYLQKGSSKDKYISALILTNIFDEVVTQNLKNKRVKYKQEKPKKAPKTKEPKPLKKKKQKEVPEKKTPKRIRQEQYTIPLEEQWIRPNKASEGSITSPSESSQAQLTGTTQIIEPNKKNINLDDLCVYCLYDFNDYDAMIFQCKECKALYHESCFDKQVDQGVCRKCDKILLW